MSYLSETKEQRLKIANIILQQLGGNRFQAMTGAKNFVALDSGLSFKIPRTNKITHVSITLTSMDDYKMEFIQVHGANVKTLHEVQGVYNDQLQEVFTQHTGLYTSL